MGSSENGQSLQNPNVLSMGTLFSNAAEGMGGLALSVAARFDERRPDGSVVGSYFAADMEALLR